MLNATLAVCIDVGELGLTARELRMKESREDLVFVISAQVQRLMGMNPKVDTIEFRGDMVTVEFPSGPRLLSELFINEEELAAVRHTDGRPVRFERVTFTATVHDPGNVIRCQRRVDNVLKLGILVTAGSATDFDKLITVGDEGAELQPGETIFTRVRWNFFAALNNVSVANHAYPTL
jgi:hypothetical protein